MTGCLILIQAPRALFYIALLWSLALLFAIFNVLLSEIAIQISVYCIGLTRLSVARSTDLYPSSKL